MSDFDADDILTGVTEGEQARRQAEQWEAARGELEEILADTESYSITVVGRNGKTFIFNYPVPLGYTLEIDEHTENEIPEGNPWDRGFLSTPPVLKRRFHGLTVRPRRDQEFTF